MSSRRICERHFSDADFFNATTKNRLTLTAIPAQINLTGLIKNYSRNQKENNVRENSEIINVHSESSSFEINDENIPGPSNTNLQTKRKLESDNKNESLKIKKLKQQTLKNKKLLANKRSEISKLRQTIRKIKKNVDRNISSSSFNLPMSKTIIDMQFKKRNEKWSVKERNFSLALHYKSPSAYKFLRDNIRLPAISSIHRWIGRSNFLPGFNELLMKQIKLKTENMSTFERKCIICFDEMSLNECLEYNKHLDLIEGFEDLGHVGRKNKAANEALVFMARGLYATWKLTLTYFVSRSGVKSTNLREILLAVVEKTIEIGLLPVATVCDQGPANRSTYLQLGVHPENPHFSVNDNNIIALYDAPHLIKSLRNNLLDGNYSLNGKLIEMNVIRKTYEADKSKKCKALVKITYTHMYPKPFQRMNVKLAVQVFSHSVASAIRTCISTGELKTESAASTADFVDIVNNLFDCLNSRKFRSNNPFNSSIHHKHSIVKATLIEAMPIFSNLKKISFKQKVSRPPCFDGIVQTVNGILKLYDNEIQETPDAYILTTRLNQDVLENLFSIFRQKGGYNRNPTVKLFRMLFRAQSVNNLIRPPSSSNCETDYDDEMNVLNVPEYSETTAIGNAELAEENASSESQSSSSNSFVAEEEIENAGTNEGESLEKCAVKYFAGYLARISLRKSNCLNCQDNMLNKNVTLSDKNELLIFHRLYANIIKNDATTGLLAPSELLTKVVDCCLEAFEKNFDKLKYKRMLRSRLYNKIIKKLSPLEWFDTNVNCNEHKKHLLEHLIITKVHKKCKDEKSAKLAKEKLRILAHF